MSLFPRFRSQVVDTGSLLPLIANFSGVRAVAADKLDSPGRQMGYQLIYELEALEGLGPALIVPLWGCGPKNCIGGFVIMYFFGTGSAAHHILANVPTGTLLPGLPY